MPSNNEKINTEPILEIHKNISIKEKLLNKGFWLYFLSFIVAPTGYIIKVILSRSISVEEIGLLYSIIGFISILATYNDLGLTDSLQYFLPQYLIDKDYIKAKSLLIFTRISQFATGIVIGLILIIVSPWLATHYFDSHEAVLILRIFALYFLIINLFQVIQSIFIAMQSVKIANGIDAIRLWSVVGFILLSRFFDILTVYTFTLAWLGGLIIGILFGLWFVYKELGRLRGHKTDLNNKDIKKRISYGFRILLGANASTILGQIDQQFALLYFGKLEAGYWSNYVSLTAILSIVTVPVMNFFLPLFNEYSKKKDTNKVKKLFIFAYLRFGLISCILGIIVFFYGREIAILLFGKQFAFSGSLYSFSAPFMRIGLFMSINFQYIASIGLVKVRVKLVLVAILTTIVSNLILAPRIGLYSLIVSNFIGWFILWIWSTKIIFDITPNSSFSIYKKTNND